MSSFTATILYIKCNKASKASGGNRLGFLTDVRKLFFSDTFLALKINNFIRGDDKMDIASDSIYCKIIFLRVLS